MPVHRFDIVVHIHYTALRVVKGDVQSLPLVSAPFPTLQYAGAGPRSVSKSLPDFIA
jgi:hypothetical protein